MKDLMANLKGCIVKAIEAKGTADMPPKVKHAATNLVFREHDRKLHELFVADKLTDEQHERAAKVFEAATKELKAIIEEIENPVKAEEPKKKLKFKVGDKVRAAKSTWLEKGKIYTIDEVDEDDDSLPYCACGYWVAEDEIEPAFKVGQRVQFKTWGEMKKEFGLDSGGDIACHCGFVTDMKPLCGTYATITRIDECGCIDLGGFSSDADCDWSFSTDMVKAVE